MAQPQPPREQPSSYQTNVNRAKTQKWVDAKSYSYDGDEWGDLDDFGEYGSYEEDSLPPSKPTGLRKPGQTTSRPPEEINRVQPGVDQSSHKQARQPHPIPGNFLVQDQDVGRMITNPQSHSHTNLSRSISFDREDETRAFSAGDPHQHSGSPAVRLQSRSALESPRPTVYDARYPATHSNSPDLTNPNPVPPPLNIPNQQIVGKQAKLGGPINPSGGKQKAPVSEAPDHPGLENNKQPTLTRNATSHDRDPFETTLSTTIGSSQTQGTPSNQSDPTLSSGFQPQSPHHPPRKSSLSQQNAPSLPLEIPPGSSSSSQGIAFQRDRSESSASLGRIIRPADIYRRMQEEKERERKSQDSIRPSLDAPSNKDSDRPMFEISASSPRSRAHMLEPVAERKIGNVSGEIPGRGIGSSDNGLWTGEKKPTTSKTFDLKTSSKAKTSNNADSSGPLLPDLSRISGFGDSFLGNDFGQISQAPFFDSSSLQPRTEPEDRNNQSSDLQHRPSNGFTSVVHQSFDNAQDQVPPTPTSTAGSTIGRSASGGTSTVSPIISRGPSTATQEWNSQLPGIDSVSEVAGQVSGPTSSDALGTPTQNMSTLYSSSHSQDEATERPPPSFLQGHRRNMSTPSPDNSPARSPAIEETRPLRRPQEVELAETTPTPTESNLSSSDSQCNPEQEAAWVSPGEPFDSEERLDAISRDSTVGLTASGGAVLSESPVSSVRNFTGRRTDSSASGRVRNLADRFESQSRPDSTHSTTPRASTLAAGIPPKEDTQGPRPVNERQESFRPRLPGGWESSASLAPISPGKPSSFDSGQTHDCSAESTPEVRYQASSLKDAREEEPLNSSRIKDKTNDTFSTRATPSTNWAGALPAVVGVKASDQQSGRSSRPISDDEDDEEVINGDAPARHRTTSVNTVIYPSASRPSLEASPDNTVSNVASTPLPSDFHKVQNSAYISKPAAQENDSNSTGNPVRKRSSLSPSSTDSAPMEYESDRLRREIAKNLNRDMVSEPTTAASDSPHQASSKYSPNDIPRSQFAENKEHQVSGSFPVVHEHDSYRNDDKDSIGDSSKASHVLEAIAPAGRQDAAILGSISGRNHSEQSTPVIISDGAQIAGKLPHTLQHRFSWEQPLHDIDLSLPTKRENRDAHSPNSPESAVYPEGHLIQAQPAVAHASWNDKSPSMLYPKMNSNDLDQGVSVMGSNVLADRRHVPAEDDVERTLAIDSDDPQDLEVVQPSAESKSVGPSEPEPVPSTGSERDRSHTARMSETNIETPKGRLYVDNTNAAPDGQVIESPDPPPPGNSQSKIPAFREILALRAPLDRIRAYDDARAQFAHLNTGLAYWIASTVSDLPQHADLLSLQSQSVVLFPLYIPRSQTGGRPLNSNANPQSSGPSGNNSGGVVGGTSLQGLSSSGGAGPKISGQQVQAKSKEFLHTAGVFGGKANVAAKGLFSKGKSKLRGNTEKATPLATPSHESTLHRESRLHQPSNFRTTHQAALESFRSQKDSRNSQTLPASNNLNHSQAQVDSPDSEHGTPSVESSQLGDDEQSEESNAEIRARPNHAHALRNLSPYLKTTLKTMKRNKGSEISHTSPITLRESPAADNYVGMSGKPSPRSTESSNKTPTQASFNQGMPSEPFHIERTESPQDVWASQPSHVNPDTATQMNLYSSRNFTDQGSNSSALMTADRPSLPIHSEFWQSNALSQDHSPVLEGESRSMQHLSIQGHEIRPKPNLGHSDNRDKSIVSSDLPFQVHDERASGLRSVQDASAQQPGLRRDPSPSNSESSPSPLSSMPTAVNQRGRTIIPVHHGISHDFVGSNDAERERSRSRSFSRPFSTPIGPAEAGGPFPRPDSQAQSAFIRQSPTAVDTAMPICNYYGQILPEVGSIPRQQAPTYNVEHVHGIDLPPSDVKPRSRRSSKSSVFFRSSEYSSASELPPVPLKSNNFSDTSGVGPSPDSEAKGKRSSVFRSLWGINGDETKTGVSRERSRSRSVTSTIDQLPLRSDTAPAAALSHADDEFPTRPKSFNQTASNNPGRRLQRTSTAIDAGQSGGKKKRLSAIGSLFGRASPKRQPKRQPNMEGPIAPTKQLPNSYSAPPASIHLGGPYRRSSELCRAPPKSGSQYSQNDTAPQDTIRQAPHEGHYSPDGVDKSQLHDTNIQQGVSMLQGTKLDAPDSVQDVVARQGTLPSPRAPGKNPLRTSVDFLRGSPQRSSFSVARISKGLRSPVHEKPSQHQESEISWKRMSTRGRSRSKESAPPSPRLNDSYQSPQSSKYPHSPAQDEPRPRHPPLPQPFRSDSYPIDGNIDTLPQTSNLSSPHFDNHIHQSMPPEPFRSNSPPPPAPPPKDEWHCARPRKTSPSQADVAPIRQASHLLAQNTVSAQRQMRQSLPALETNVPSPKLRMSKRGSTYRNSASKDSREANNMLTPEVKRRSRQQEIEIGHLTSPLSPASGFPAQTEAPRNDETVVMSATSFPGQEWMPGGLSHYEE